MARRWPRLSLLGQFSLLALLALVALALALGAVLQHLLERRALRDAERNAGVVARVGVLTEFYPPDLERVPDPARLDMLDANLAARFTQDGLEKVKVLNRERLTVYANDRTLAGRRALDNEGFKTAMAGDVFSEIEQGVDDSGEGRKTLEVYMPLRWRAAGPVDGVLEVYLPYDPVAAAVRADVRTLWLVIAGGTVLLYLALFRIVSRASRRLRHQALHDALTGLPNRTLLHERVEDALTRARRSGEGAALLLVDLDGFKEVNDTLGHDHGDRLLVEVAGRLQAVLRRTDTLARLGGDEFAVLLAEVPHRGAVAELAGRLQDALRLPFALGGVSVVLEGSVGVALFPDHGADVTTLLQRADVAMYEAKRAGTRIETYAAERDPYSADRLALMGELRGAIEGDQLTLHYQPKVTLATGEVSGVEALVRWRHPERGIIGPDQFIPLAETTGTINDLTGWVLDAALAQCRAWRNRGVVLPVAVNLAGASVVDAGLPDAVRELLARHHLPGEMLECEISEHTVMAEPQRALDVLARLRALGVRLSLDDFGTGHSSLSYLKRLPLDEVKIDRSFVQGMADDEDDAVIVRSTIDLGRNLGLLVVAEGVESQEVLEELAALKCDVAQGYLLSRPLPALEFEGWLARAAGAQALRVNLRGPGRAPSSTRRSS